MSDDICQQLDGEIVEMNVQVDHVHLLVKVPPKLSLSQLMGVLKGRTAVRVFTEFPSLRKKPYWGNHFWAKGYLRGYGGTRLSNPAAEAHNRSLNHGNLNCELVVNMALRLI